MPGRHKRKGLFKTGNVSRYSSDIRIAVSSDLAFHKTFHRTAVCTGFVSFKCRFDFSSVPTGDNLRFAKCFFLSFCTVARCTFFEQCSTVSRHCRCNTCDQK